MTIGFAGERSRWNVSASMPISRFGGGILHHRSGRILLVAALVLGAAQAAEAAAPEQIAFSEKLGAEVFANPDASGQWCRDTVSLSLLLKDNSPLLGAGLSGFVARVGGTLPPKCADVTRARVAVYRDSDRKLIAGPYTISKTENWAAPQEVAAAPPPETAKSEPQPQPQPQPQAQSGYAPPELNPFNVLLVAKVADNATLLDDDAVLRYWAETRFPRDYGPVSGQEFKVRPVLAKARADLQEAVAQAAAGKVTLLVNAQIGAYDFQHSAFPITGLGDQVTFNRPIWGPMNLLGGSVQFTLPELPGLSQLPMDPQEAEAYIARHTRWGMVERGIVIAVAVSYAPRSDRLEAGFTKVSGHIDRAWILDGGKPIHSFGPDQLAELQRAYEDRQRAARVAVLAKQREQTIASLSGLPTDAKLANFLSAAPGVEPYARLDNLAIARGQALLSRKPVSVRMLVQADSGGDHADTRWPGHLRVTAPSGAPGLERGGWYLVDGTLSLEGASEDLKPAELTAKTLFACKQALCADAQDPAAIVDHKLAALGNL